METMEFAPMTDPVPERMAVDFEGSLGVSEASTSSYGNPNFNIRPIPFHFDEKGQDARVTLNSSLALRRISISTRYISQLLPRARETDDFGPFILPSVDYRPSAPQPDHLKRALYPACSCPQCALDIAPSHPQRQHHPFNDEQSISLTLAGLARPSCASIRDSHA